MGPYIPNKDVDLVTWGNTFASALTANPAAYGIDAGDALLIQTEYDDYAAAYTIATDPATRTPETVAHKNGEKALFLADARYFAQLISANRGVSNEDKIAAGLVIPDTVPTPVPTPTTAPQLQLVGATPGIHTIRYHDESTPTTKAKPFGVIGALLFRVLATTDAGNFDMNDGELIADLTKSPAAVPIPEGNSGKIATYRAFWFTRTGLFGPLSQSVAMACP